MSKAAILTYNHHTGLYGVYATEDRRIRWCGTKAEAASAVARVNAHADLLYAFDLAIESIGTVLTGELTNEGRGHFVHLRHELRELQRDHLGLPLPAAAPDGGR